MKIKSKLLSSLGPFIIALLIVIVILYSPINWFAKPTKKDLHDSASSMSINVLKGNALKNEAIASGAFLPFFGSSELSRVNAFHPSVLAKKYNRPYEPFLLGAPGTQSLTHSFMIDSAAKDLTNHKVVFIISPQWFVKDGVPDPMFSLFYSPLETYQWLMNIDEYNETTTYVANRLLSFDNIKSDTQMKRLLKKVKKEDSFTKLDKQQMAFRYKSLQKEDHIFSKIGVKSKNNRIDKRTDDLPNVYDFNVLDQLASQIGKEKTDNNEFEITNNFYSKRIAPIKGTLKNSQKGFNYLSSPEYADFQVVLEQMAEYNIDPLFVIPPVNKKWSDYTGLSTDMLDDFSDKITTQLTSQGFNHIVDFTSKRDEPYFMEDTIHIGWRGWLDLDRELQTFLADEERPTYHLDSAYYYSKEWQKKKPETNH